jgi:predicted RNA-binding protein with PIN domain
MPKIKNFTFPPELVEALAEYVQEIPEELLVSWGRECLPGGFTRAEAIRERLILRLRAEAPLDPNTLKLLELGLPYREFVRTFSLETLQELHDPVEVLLGREPLLLALLVDPRDHVVKWASEQAAKPPASEPTSEREILAEAFVRDMLYDRVLESLAIPMEPLEDSPGDPLPNDFLEALEKSTLGKLNEKVVSQQSTIDRLNKELHQQKERYLGKMKEQTEAAEREKKKLLADLTAAQSRMQGLLKEKEAAEARVKELSSRVESAVARGIEEQTAALVRKWLEAPLQTEAVVRDLQVNDSDLLGRANRVLEAQTRQDRHTGNRVELERRLQSLREAQGRLDRAAHTAITTVPELKPTLADIEAEIVRIEKTLGAAKPVSDFTARLLASINHAAEWDSVREWSRVVDELAERDLVPAGDLRAFYNALQRKFSLLAETSRQKEPEGDNGWSLRETLFRNRSALLLLDGHNILFGLRDIFAPHYEEGFPRGKARQRLIEVTSRLLHNRQNVRTKICFDGPDGRTHRAGPNLEVVYSGGTGKNRVDDLIVSHLQFKDLTSLDQKVFVVTDDREVRRGIVQTGAKFVPADLFAVFLQDFKCL